MFTIDTQPVGTTTVSGKSVTNCLAENVFVIEPHIWYLTPIIGSVGTIVTIKGDGYAESEQVRIDFGTTVSINVVTALPTGAFDTTFTIDTQLYGTTTVTAWGATNGHGTRTTFFVTSSIYLTSPMSGTVGTLVSIIGCGYGMSETIQVIFGTKGTITSTTSDNGGMFTASFTVNTQPHAEAGNFTLIKGYGTASNQIAQSDFSILPKIISVTPGWGTVGTIITVHGDGFSASKNNITMKFGSTTFSLFKASSNIDGTWTISFTVDTQVAGSTTVNAQDPIAISTVPNYFKIVAQITNITPTSGTVGRTVSVFGNGYGANELVGVSFGDYATIGTATSNGNGQFATNFVVNSQQYGTTTIVGVGTSTSERGTGTFFLTPRLDVISPDNGFVGSLITMNGCGYESETNIRVAFGLTPTITQGQAGSKGTFTIIFTIDSQPYGSRTVTVYQNPDDTKNASNQVFIKSRITSVSPSSATVGRIITVSGTGYGVSESVYLDFGNMLKANMYTTSGYGTFTNTFVINAQVFGTTTVRIYPLPASDLRHEYTEYLNIRGAIYHVAPTSGGVGKVVSIWGNGFGNAEHVSIKFGTHVDIVAVTTTDNGEFTVSWTVDTQGFGTTTITANGITTGEQAENIFIIKGSITYLSPTSGTVGTAISINGDGFGSSEIIRISFGKNMTIAAISSNSVGSFTTSFTIDIQSYGTKTVQAYGINSSTSDTVKLSILPKIIDLMPTTGTIGTSVTVTGNGYITSGAIRIDIGLTEDILIQNNDEASEDGTFSVIFNIDDEPFGSNTVTVRSRGSLVNDTRCFVVSPMVYVTPVSGTVGAFITVTGNGYASTEVIQIDFGTNLGYATTSTIASGAPSAFRGSWQRVIAVDIQPYGTTTIKATGLGSNDAKECLFNIMQRLTAISPSCGTVGSSVTVDGNGYAALENIRIGFGKNTSICSTLANGIGVFQAIWTVDTQAYGVKTVVTSGAGSGSDTTTYTVMPHIVSVSPSVGTVGASVTIVGDGFTTSESIFVDFGTTSVIKTAASSIDGTWTISFTVNIQTQGTKTIWARDSSAIGTTSTFVINPNITEITPAAGTVGSSVIVTGNGYFATGNVYIYFGTPTTSVIGTTSASSAGTFTKDFVVNTQPYGSTTVIAKDMVSGKQSIGSFTIKSNIYEVTPVSGTVGSLVTIRGTGYIDEMNRQIRVDFGDTMTICSNIYTEGTNGTFSAVFNVNTQAYGTTTIKATYVNDANQTAERAFTIQPAIYKISPTIGTIGAGVVVYGNGFVTGDVVSVKFGQTTGIATATVEAQGSWTATFMVNTQPLGLTSVTASGTMNTAAIIMFTIVPKITLVSPRNGTVGTIVRVEGNGYQASELINIRFGSMSVITSVSAFSDGSFTTTWTVNIQKYGTTSITATGQASNGSATSTFFIQPELYSVSPNAGTVGRMITVSGTGFGANNIIRVQFGETTSITNKQASANGSWTASFTINIQVYGTTTIVANDTVLTAATASNTLRILPYIKITPTQGSV
ncbi:hypothetical protein COZ71_02145, partial [Candidatus Desantisbacteria bacterium CG_4_8_14_3_um_filter_40_12]